MACGRHKRVVGRPTQSTVSAVVSSPSEGGPDLCLVCNEIVKDQSSVSDGDDALKCEGHCQGWLHRCCAGVSSKQFSALSDSEDPYLCTICSQQVMRDTIKELKESVSALQMEVKALRLELKNSTQSTSSATPVAVPVSGMSPPVPSLPTEPLTLSNPVNARNISSKPFTSRQNSNSDRLFNIVVAGIPECKEGQSRRQRLLSDLRNVSSLFTQSTVPIPPFAIHDCHRLGKYSPSNPRPRSILVRFNSCAVAMDVLSRKSSFRPYVIKPDLPPDKRAQEKILLKERWNLIQSGVDKTLLKIKRSSLLVKGSTFGHVKDSVFVRLDQASELVPGTPILGFPVPSAADQSAHAD